MKKKITRIVLLSLLVSLGVAYIVLYCIYPTNTQKYTWLVFDYICNKPLPVIGISVLMLAIIVYKIIRFVVKNRTTKVSKLESEIAKLKNELKDSIKLTDVMISKAEIEINALCEKIDNTNENIKEICATIPNKKVRALGEELYGSSEEKAD